MPIVKVADLAFGRLQSPSLDQAEEFLTRFGMVRAERTKDRLYMRGTDAAPYIHITHLGPSRFLGLGFHAAAEDDLKKLAKAPGAKGIENIDEPGGGKRVRVTDPLGYDVDVVWGQREVEELPIRKHTMNWGYEKLRRAGDLMRLNAGASQVKRIAHAVLMTQGARKVTQWYREMLGFIPSDEVYAGPKENIIASFNRCDRGDEYVDHHTFLCFEGPNTGLNHLSFEVASFDDLMLGHEHLKNAGKYEHVWGIGRHLLGSQIYDYWKDPWGRVHEHWTDTDVLNARTPPNLLSAEEGLRSQWGTPPPESFITHAIR
jgi:glyoxalase/bleomycin resistance protein/dioxygenase superfamily protein